MSFTELLNKFVDLKTTDIQLGMVCQIESFDDSGMRADVKPLLKIENDLGETKDFPILADIPVMFYNGDPFAIKPAYTKGDMVWVGFATHDIENALQEYSRTASKKTFEMHNACVLGAIVKDDFSFDNVYMIRKESDHIALGKKDGMAEWLIKAESFNMDLNIFITALTMLTGGNPAQNAAAIVAIVAAANALKPKIGLWNTEDTKAS